jgi:hypothetical protein
MLDMEHPVRGSLGVAPDEDRSLHPDGDGAPGSGGRLGRLRQRLPKGPGRGAAKVRAEGEDSGSYDLRNAWQVVAGSILIPLGVIFILLAWYGAAHAREVQQQIPYMVSGSFIGLGCMVLGGFLYWGHWLYRLYDQKELHHEEELGVLRELVGTLASTAAEGGAHSPLPTPDGHPGTAAGTLLVTATGTVYHRAGCPVTAHHPEDVRVAGAADLAGLHPCQICSPGSQPSVAAPSSGV